MKQHARQFKIVGTYIDENGVEHTFVREEWEVPYNDLGYIIDYTDSLYRNARNAGQDFPFSDDDYPLQKLGVVDLIEREASAKKNYERMYRDTLHSYFPPCAYADDAFDNNACAIDKGIMPSSSKERNDLC